MTSVCTLAFQNGLSGSSLLSEDNTDEQNRRLLSVATALNHYKNILLHTHSAQRYEIADLARCFSCSATFSCSLIPFEMIPYCISTLILKLKHDLVVLCEIMKATMCPSCFFALFSCSCYLFVSLIQASRGLAVGVHALATVKPKLTSVYTCPCPTLSSGP